ncbi:hypothetical protein A2X44_02825 [candidate division CPR3 bacterium GWF2_35_18]|uniref:N-acetyltransferase domain-containing protein n=1 Tax=candidate division CPR3 bacterium GW2011_GWF2_35_18 TaxID=1618350 RepID=A0A0G0E2K1_UNCC3|nr:MAG: hypothetical protein UR67_C0006G0012 [candidate division CPR3 bacterium GW2011_GWF2_35_18]KKP86773.1 MAG: hypothetical protein UR87_C0011G0013 [candidate division CPR3 bacterium GW2011_GWE2_35_7]OGB62919.1 MAG: hypothetical protein A2X44_02825 [candidate division CPR3 bacterium GWF2_35_18]OGB65955.1 MAG: hypothetical protein A2250_03565 [candidate division CPR3 bacterium RIFOXYA2_FULL_35_13]OGB76275.1 MAG: hypothetical protein A2476_02455 [candidate division CPR3 bacterium RIFOXYC2_FULL
MDIQIIHPTLADISEINALILGHGNGGLLPVNDAEFQRRVESGDSLILKIDGVIVSYIALTPVNNHAVEVRSLVTERELRRHGYGTVLITEILKLAQINYPDRIVVAMVSGKSEGIFRNHNFIDPTPKELGLLDELLVLCWTTCPNFSKLPLGKICCHTFLVWHNGKEERKE